MRSEKITVNLSSVELAQVDFLVEKGLYTSRADFIRLAIRKQTEGHQKEIEQFMEPDFGEEVVDKARFGAGFIGLGTCKITKADIAHLLEKNKKIYIRVMGVLTIEKGVTVEDLQKTIHVCKVVGKIIAEPDVKSYLQTL